MAEDHATRAKRLEDALNWEGARIEWQRACRENHPGAAARLNRARSVCELSAEMLHAAKAALDEGDLRAATEPLQTLHQMLPRDHPEAHALRLRWLDMRAATKKRIHGAELCIALVCGVVAGLLYFGALGVSVRALVAITIVVVGVACSLLQLIVPALRKPPPLSAIRSRRRKKRGRRRVAREGGAPQPAPGSSPIDRWRRAAKREKDDIWS